jgi:hypothetical protein
VQLENTQPQPTPLVSTWLELDSGGLPLVVPLLVLVVLR